MKDKKRIIYTVFVLLCITGLIAFKISGSLVHDNQVNQIKTNSGTLSSPTLGEWEVTNEWVDLSTNGNVTIEDGHATINATSNFAEDNELTYRSHITYTGGTATSNFSSATEYYEGFVMYWSIGTFPFMTRDSDITESNYVWTEDVNNNRIVVEKKIEGEDKEIFAYIKFNSLVNRKKQKNEQFAWRLNTEQWPYQIEIYNSKEIDAANDIDATFDITFQVVPSLLEDNFDNAESFEPKIILENSDEYLDDIPRDNSISYNAKIEGTLEIANVVKADPIVYEEWNSNWGTNPDSDNIYFYVLYSVDASINATKPFNNDPNLMSSIIPNTNDGELVAYSDGSTFKVGNTSAFAEDYSFTLPDNDWNFASYALLSNLYPTTTDFTRTFVVKYEKPSSGTVTKNFSVDIEATGDGEFTTEKETVNWSVDYTSSGVVTPTYPSGYNNNISIEYEDTSSGIGAINKLDNSNVDFSLLIEPTSAEMNKLANNSKVKAFNNWNATNEGTNNYNLELATTKSVLDSSYDYVSSEKVLNSSEYNLVSISPTITKYDYVLNNTSYVLSENNTDTGTLKVSAEINGTWEEIGSLTTDGTTVNYIANNSKTTSVTGVSNDNPIILPANTTNVKINYTGTKAAIYIGLRLNLRLLTNAKTSVNSVYNSNNSAVIRQYANTKVNSEVKDTKYKDTNLTKLESRSTMTYTSTKTKNTNSNTISYESKVTEEIEYNSTISSIATSSIKEQKNAKFYLLLPQGGNLVDESIVVKDINGNIMATSNSTTNLFQNTNRKLVTVTINGFGTNTKIQSNKLLSGYTINYQVDYPHTANRDYGNIIYGDIAYYSENKITDGYANANNANTNLFSSNIVKTAFASLETKDSSYLFKTNTITVDPVATSLGTLKSYVKNSVDSEHIENTSVKIGNNYQYKIEYSYSDPLTEMSDLVIYTSLENAYGSNSYWQGTLSSIDTSALEALGITPTIYYSEKSNLDLTNERNLDLSKTDTWSSDAPSNMSSVKAVAFDCSSIIFTGVKIPIVYLNMVSSLNRNDINNKAYNNALIRFTTMGEVKTITSNTSTIKLEDASVSLDVVPKESLTGTEYNKGTEMLYASINETLGYLYHVNNSDEVNYNNVNITSKLSDNLTVKENEIVYYTDINNPHPLGSAITYTNTNNTIDLNINNLAASTDLYIFIPVSIDASNLSEENSKYTSVSSINRLSDKAFNTTEIKTFNRANIPSISAVHTTKTIYNNNVFSSEDTYVNKGETITNMIKVTNDVDIEAKNITIIETLPNNVTIDDASITNGGVHSGNKITWNIPSLLASDSLELTYNITIPNNPANNTYFNTSTKVEMLNPYDNTKKIVDKTLEYGSVVYRNITDIKITNTIEGTLANKNKEFSYKLEIEAPTYAAGEYIPKYTVNGSTKDGTKLTIGEDGKATYNFTLAGGGELLITNIPGGYTIKLSETASPGYTTSLIDRTIDGMGIEDTIDENTEEHLRTYAFLNVYNATGEYTPVVRTTYDQELVADMFQVNMNTNGSTTSLTNDVNGNVNFSTITYDNVVGTFNYTFTETRGTNERIMYDSTTYNVTVKVTDNGEGRLVTEVNVYDATGSKQNEIVFNNKFIKVGLLVKNNNTGDYINTNKVFNYKIIVDQAAPSTNYKVTNQNEEELEEFVTDENGSGVYEISLKHGEYIILEELPVGSNYIVEEKTENYYTSTIEGIEATVEDGILRTSGSIILATTQIIYNNNYSTEANFAPKANVILKDKVLENNEFIFLITDISDGVTNGYNEVARNDADGNIYFTNIKYTRPGTYIYEIQQLTTENPNIVIDKNKLILTLILEDNEDGTMSVKSNYKYLNGSENFINAYSELPIIEDEVSRDLNPNTVDKTIYMLIIAFLAAIFIMIGRIINVKKYNKV